MAHCFACCFPFFTEFCEFLINWIIAGNDGKSYEVAKRCMWSAERKSGISRGRGWRIFLRRAFRRRDWSTTVIVLNRLISYKCAFGTLLYMNMSLPLVWTIAILSVKRKRELLWTYIICTFVISDAYSLHVPHHIFQRKEELLVSSMYQSLSNSHQV